MPLGIDVWMDFGGSLVPNWSQVGIDVGAKIDVNFERLFFRKPLFSQRENNDVHGSCREVRARHPPKIDPKMESKMECFFATILNKCLMVLGAKLIAKTDQKSIKQNFRIYDVWSTNNLFKCTQLAKYH